MHSRLENPVPERRASSVPVWSKMALAGGAFLFVGSILHAQQGGVLEQGAIVNYVSPEGLADPVTKLQNDLNTGKVKLQYEPKHGYLISVLKALNVPVSSQTLVFSKTSSQAANTSPDSPRALYYNDTVYIGWAKNDPLLDIISIDPVKGTEYFTLSQNPIPKPEFDRNVDTCMTCHMTPRTFNIPGLIVKSVLANNQGHAISQANTFIAGHNNPLSERWGGWYVTGKHGTDTHMGNAFLAGMDPAKADLKATSNITDLSSKIDTSKFLTPTSDTVALMVLDHSVRMVNLITNAQYAAIYVKHDLATNAKLAASFDIPQMDRAASTLVQYMLMRNEAPLHGPIEGTGDFQKEFSAAGPRDSKGRSLREFDLTTRLFKYPCSYEIYSAQFDALPPEVKDLIWNKVDLTLTGSKNLWPQYPMMSPEDRANVREILLDTKPDYKAWVQSHPTSGTG